MNHTYELNQFNSNNNFFDKIRGTVEHTNLSQNKLPPHRDLEQLVSRLQNKKRPQSVSRPRIAKTT
jgi:hypothetical protein